jgi:hypothetical protein
MFTYQQMIESAYGLPYDQIKSKLNLDLWIFKDSLMRDFPDWHYDSSKFDEIFDHGARIRPKVLRNYNLDNHGWKLTKYYQYDRTDSSNMANFFHNRYYHLGYMEENGNFIYYGIHQFDIGGFIEHGTGILLKPTHCKLVEETKYPCFYKWE